VMKQGWKWVWANRWLFVALGFMAINLYGVIRVRPKVVEVAGPAQPEVVYVDLPAPTVISAPTLGATQAVAVVAEGEGTIAEDGEKAVVVGALSIGGISVETSTIDSTVLHVLLSDEVNAEMLRRMLSVEPEVDVSISVHQWSWRRQHYAQVRGPLVPGQSYTLRIAGALQNAAGTACLAGDFVRTIRVPDARADIRIRHSGRYLSPAGNLRLPLRGVNVSAYTLKVYRIAPRNLVQYAMREGGHYSYFYGEPDNNLRVPLASRTYKLDAEHNRAVESSVDLRSILPEQLVGAYVIEVEHEGRVHDRRMIVVTDTGMTVKRSPGALLVWANSIRTLEAIDAAVVQVWSPTGGLLAEGMTDADGLAGIPLDTDATEEPFLVSIARGDDLSFLSLDTLRQEVGATNAGAGAYLQAGYEAFVYTDRGVYRPGETAYVQAIVRGPHLVMPEAFPVEMEITRPDGRRHRREQAVLSTEGTVGFVVQWRDFDATGRYRVDVRTPGAASVMGTTSIMVEEFVPPRIVVEATADKVAYATGENIALAVSGRYLYGAAASGNPVQAHFYPQPAVFSPKGHDDYVFGDAETTFSPAALRPVAGMLDAEGQASFSLAVPADWRPVSMLRGVLTAQVMDQGGRAVTAYTACDIHAYPFYIGLRGVGLGAAKPGDESHFDWVVMAPDGTPLTDAQSLDVALDKLQWTVVLTEDTHGRGRYESRLQRVSIRQQKIETDVEGRGRWRVSLPESGFYLMTVRDPKSGAASSLRFFVGGEYDRWHSRSMDRPGTLELQFDREQYQPGDTARLTVTAPFAGKALLTLEQDDVLYRAVQDVLVNTVTFEIPVTTNLWPNAHASVRVIRPVAPAGTPQVYRATGSIPLQLDTSARRLGVALQAPEQIRPLTQLEVVIDVKAPDGEPREASFTIAAVDEGICMLTQFQTPDPLSYFSALRKHGFVNYDLYALLMPETDTSMDTVRSHTGGDIAMLLRGRLNPVRSRRFRPVALWQGSQMTDSNGQARVTFDVPEFTGSLRLMVVASSGDTFGSAGTQVRVARPLTVLSSLPRFMAPGDAAELPIELHYNGTGAMSGTLAITAVGPVRVDRAGPVDLTLQAGERQTLDYVLQAADAVGAATVMIRADFGDEAFVEEIELPVRPVAARSTFHSAFVVAPGERKTIPFDQRLLPGSETYKMQVSATPEVKYSGALAYLLTYPHGCLEQTVSTAIPLLYLADIPNDGALVVGDSRPMIEHGITRVLSMQLANGNFGYWPNSGEVYAWGTTYALDFLLQARAAGYAVPEDRLASSWQALGQYLARPMVDAANVGSSAWQHDAAIRAYICQVLAQAGQARHDWTARLLEQGAHLQIDTRLRLVLALAEGGRRRDAWTLLENILDIPLSDVRETSGALVSPVRTAALRLLAWVQLAPADARAWAAMADLDRQLDLQRWHTTQDSGMALLAMSRFLAAAPAQERSFSALLQQGNQRWMVDSVDGGTQRVFPDGAPVRITNHGPGPIYVASLVSGISMDALAAEDKGLLVRREYFNMDLSPLQENRVKQGELLLVRLIVKTASIAEHVVIEDLLPAGLEIENANLATSQQTGWRNVQNTLPVRHADVRDDRLVIFAGKFEGVQQYHYTVRAVSPGTYQLPHVSAEEMYDPGVSSRSGAGVMVVEGL
jgi:alpha-2-macroglobulin